MGRPALPLVARAAMTRKRRSIRSLVLAPLVVPLLWSPGAAAGVDFSGKTLTALVGFSAGGPVDGFARLVASRLGAHLPGKPTVIVQNKPGAGSVVAANYLY